MITQAADAVGKYDDSDLHQILLTPPKGAEKKISNRVQEAYKAGRQQITNEAQASKSVVDDFIKRLVELTLSRVINEVQSAAASIIASLGVLGLDRQEIENRIEQELDDRSDAPFDRIAAQAINSAVNEGRRAEMVALSDQIETYEYSAILDKNTCPECESWDGKQGDIDELPDTPNPDCEGGANCRCFTIAIFKTENQ